ncbi:MAG TPA: hypothetical protein VHW26_07540 [Solirubrobacteraceae bacterium]|jgi:hypothetical protein|nr:hypothetical protein [Solirubrobacteraceae bacterium]
MVTFLLTTLAYPAILAALCLGTGLLVDRCARRTLPGVLLPAVGVAGLVGVSQLSTDLPASAPATPFLIVLVAVAGFVLGAPRIRTLASPASRRGWQIGLPVAVYVIALAPLLFAGRPTFSSYGLLPDSAVHMIGADFLIHHGRDYAHLDPTNSYGQYIRAYFATSYPSGADTLFGGSAPLLGLPLIWAFQPFNAFVLATAAGPAWLLARELGLRGWWAGAAALSATVPALVYGYELVASIKEVTALPMILTMGALVVRRRSSDSAIPFAVVAAAGVSALGVAFTAWVLVALAIPACALLATAAAGARQDVAGLLRVGGLAAGVTLVLAWPTWSGLSGSVAVAENIAGTTNAGNLVRPLRIEQVAGAWFSRNYTGFPHNFYLDLTSLFVGVTLAAAVLGAVHLVRAGTRGLAGWCGLMLVAWLALTAYGATWTDAKILMLTSPVVVLLAWAGVAGIRASPIELARSLAAPVLGVVLAAGVLGSDAVQYHDTVLAPTARYDELASLNSRFAGRGPTLFTDFDEWSLYELRGLDIGGPDFVFRPLGLEAVVAGHGDPVDLDRVPPASFLSYPLIITRRDPTASRPPSAYGLLWEGSYYDVWRRLPGALAAHGHIGRSHTVPVTCAEIGDLARVARSAGVGLVAANPVVRVRVVTRGDKTLRRSRGSFATTFDTPGTGTWDLWLKGELMSAIRVRVDGRLVATIEGQVSGNEVNSSAARPLRIRLAAGPHTLDFARTGPSLAPGAGGAAYLSAAFLTRPGAGARERLVDVAPADWRSLCVHRPQWVEATGPATTAAVPTTGRPGRSTVRGAAGATGPTGISGPTGTTGATGASEPTGASGASGPTRSAEPTPVE